MITTFARVVIAAVHFVDLGTQLFSRFGPGFRQECLQKVIPAIPLEVVLETIFPKVFEFSDCLPVCIVSTIRKTLTLRYTSL